MRAPLACERCQLHCQLKAHNPTLLIVLNLYLQVWVSATANGTSVERGLKSGLNSLQLPVDTTCTAGCAVSVVLSWPRLDEPFAPASVPVSPAFDASAPSFVRGDPADGSSMPVAVESTTLQLELSDVTSNGTAAALDDGAGSAFFVEPGVTVTLGYAVTECTRTAVACAAAEDTYGDYGATYDDSYAPPQVSAPLAAAPAGADEPCGTNGTLAMCAAPSADVWLLVVAVDKAWLELQAYSQPELDSAFSRAAAVAGDLAHSLQNYLPPAVLALWLQVQLPRLRCAQRAAKARCNVVNVLAKRAGIADQLMQATLFHRCSTLLR